MDLLEFLSSAPGWISCLLLIGVILKNVPLKDLFKKDPYVLQSNCHTCMEALGRSLDDVKISLAEIRSAIINKGVM
jgi:hypothetical protein